jgi:beta-glucosidase
VTFPRTTRASQPGFLKQSCVAASRKTETETSNCDAVSWKSLLCADGFPELIVQLVRNGGFTEERIDYSVRELMRQNFEIGLFDHPLSTRASLAPLWPTPYVVRLGKEYQRRTFTLLTNAKNFPPLPAASRTFNKLYIEGINSTVLQKYNIQTVATPEEADYAILCLRSPSKPTTLQGALGEINNGTLEYGDEEKACQAKIYSAAPTIVDIKFNRPTAVPEIVEPGQRAM